MAPEDRSERPRIECVEGGPYLVTGLEKLTSSKGEPIPTRPRLALCRCGASKGTPFCDGTHARIDFDTTRISDGSLDRRDDYAGRRITIHDNRGICSHAGCCTGGLPEVWRMGIEPWIDPDGAEPEAVVETIRRCPSGALSYTIDGVEHRDQERGPEIHISRDGPYVVRGGIELLGVPRGQGASLEHYTLCRCGGSKNKPFCDGTHWHIEFVDEEGEKRLAFCRVAGPEEIAEGEVCSVTVGSRTLALVRKEGAYAAVDGACPHQGGPLGEGTFAGGLLRCPWHGWQFDPFTGKAAETGHGRLTVLPLEIRNDGIYVQLEEIVKPATTVSDLMIDTMIRWGVRHVFGIVGHSNLGLAEAIRRQEARGRLTYIGVRHEGAAAFAASGFAKLTGRPAACLTIAGPGATNLLTGLWDAKVDRAPVLALTGQVQTQVLGPGAFQEIDLASAFQAVAVFSQTVLPESRHAELMALACKNALVERDVTHLIFPDEVQILPAPEGEVASRPDGRIAPGPIEPPAATIETAEARIAQAASPAIVVGFGARAAMPQIVRLAERLGAPVLTTFKAKGSIPDTHPLATGVLGRSGTPVAAWAMSRADLLLVFGASFSNHTGIDRGKPIIQVDFDRTALGRFHPVDVPVWGEIGATVERIAERLPDRLAARDARGELAELWKDWRAEKQKRARIDRGNGLSSAAIFAALTRQAPEDAVIAVDVGNNTYSFGRYFESAGQSILMSGYLGSIGFGFPAAIGAWAAAPERPILAVAGDGGLGQYLGEFTTAVKYRMKITLILVNNNELGKISKEQRAGRWKVWQTSLVNPDFAAYARICGGHGVRVTEVGELDGAIAGALAHEGPAIVEVIADPELI